MVGRSKSSMRRPALRGERKQSRSRSPVHQILPPPPVLRSKRPRISSVSDHEQAKKRRRGISNTLNTQLTIPLRGKIPPKPITVTQVLPSRNSVSRTITKPPDSPRPKAQYDQIKRIEEKAKQIIHNRSLLGISAKDEKRALRSQDGGSRSKSELAMYFNNYEQMLSLNPPKPEVLTARTRIVLVDDVPDFVPPRLDDSPNPADTDPFGAKIPLNNVQFLNLSTYTTQSSRLPTSDPLSPSHFERFHRKAERHEKQIRNIERERASHEKVQLDRLLEELKGPDWLRVMGISGITESEKKLYEPKRVMFVKEVKAMIEKFKHWKEEEKRRKAERERAALTVEHGADDDEGEDDAEDEDEEVEDSAEEASEEGGPENDAAGEDSPDISPLASPRRQSTATSDPNEIDALASQQLLAEASATIMASDFRKPRKYTRRKAPNPATEDAPPVALPEEHKPFTSFYSKRHIRDAAVSGVRRSRTLSAFGQPVPELEEMDFELPEEVCTAAKVRSRQRERRRVRRGSEEG